MTPTIPQGLAVDRRRTHRRVTLLAFAIAVLAFSLGGDRSAAAPQSPPTAQQQFKNVQILKDLPAHELIPAMQFISASLGVQCDFCHVRDEFEKDDKETKKVARRMMSMMLAINGQHFQGERAVTCNTCHRGSAKAVAIPMIEASAPYVGEASTAQPGKAQSGLTLPAPEEIVSRFVIAVGGEGAIEKISSRVEKGTVTFGGGPSMEVEVSTKTPGKQTMTIHLPQGEAVTAFDGQKGWLSAPGSPVHDMNEADFEGARLDSDLQFPVHLKTMFREFKVIQKERVGDHETILVFAMNPGQPPLELYFDQDSGLLVRQIRFSKSPLGLNPTRIDYTDYKQFNGVEVPLHLTIDRPNRKLDIQFAQVAQNIPINDASFQHP